MRLVSERWREASVWSRISLTRTDIQPAWCLADVFSADFPQISCLFEQLAFSRRAPVCLWSGGFLSRIHKKNCLQMVIMAVILSCEPGMKFFGGFLSVHLFVFVLSNNTNCFGADLSPTSDPWMVVYQMSKHENFGHKHLIDVNLNQLSEASTWRAAEHDSPSQLSLIK